MKQPSFKASRIFQIALGIFVEVLFFFFVYLAGFFLCWLLYQALR